VRLIDFACATASTDKPNRLVEKLAQTEPIQPPTHNHIDPPLLRVLE
jgi:hypothetical protein